MAILASGDARFYHPVDDLVEQTQSLTWSDFISTANFVSGLITSGLKTDEAATQALIYYPSPYTPLNPDTVATCAVWVSGFLTSDTDTRLLEIGFAKNTGSPLPGDSLGISKTASTSGFKVITTIDQTDKSLDWTPPPANDSDWHLFLINIEYETSGWRYRVSLDGNGWVDLGVDDNTDVFNGSFVRPVIFIDGNASEPKYIVDEVVLWGGNDLFTDEELSNLYELFNTHGTTMDQYTQIYGTPVSGSTDLFLQVPSGISVSGDLFLHGHRDIPVFGEIFFGNESEFLADKAEDINIIRLSENKVVVVYRDGNDGDKNKAKVGTINNTDITFGTPTQLATLLLEANLTRLSDNKFVAVYQDIFDSSHGTARIGTVSGTTITFGDESEFLSSGTATAINSSRLDDNSFVVVYEDGDNLDHNTAKIGTVSGTTITFGNKTEFRGSSGPSEISVSTLDSTKFVISYRRSAGGGTTKVGTVSGTDIIFGTRTDLATSASVARISISTLNASGFVVIYSDSADSNLGSAQVGSVSGTDITLGTESDFFTPGTYDGQDLVAINSYQVIVTYKDNIDANHGTAKIGTINGTDITFSEESEFLSVSGILAITSIDKLDTNKFIVAYIDTSDSDHGTAKVGLIPPGTTSNPLFALGSQQVTTSGDLFTTGFDQITEDTTLYIPGQLERESTTLFIKGIAQISGSATLYTMAANSISTSGDLFIEGFTDASGSPATPLFIEGHSPVSGSIDDYIEGHVLFSGSMNLFVSGIPGNSADLYIAGPILMSGNIDSFTIGHAIASGNATLTIPGGTPDMKAFVEVVENNPTGNLDLFIHGAPSGESSLFHSNASATLFIGDDVSSIITTDTWSSFVRTADPAIVLESGTFFGFARVGNTVDNSADLYINAHASGENVRGVLNSGSFNAFIEGLSTQDGDEGLLSEGFFSTSEETSSFAKVHLGLSGAVNCFISGVVVPSGSVDLFIFGITDTTLASGDLYIPGLAIVSGSHDAFIFGIEGAQSGSIILYIEVANSGLENQQSDLYINGF